MQLAPSSANHSSCNFEVHSISKGNKYFKPISQPVYQVCENRLSQKHSSFSIEYLNTAEGMRQNFIIEQPLNNTTQDELTVRLEINKEIVLFQNTANSVALFDPKGVFLGTYSDLKVWDAQQNILPSRMYVEGNAILLAVNDQNATYPITIDPLVSRPSWFAELNQNNAQLGISISSAGDVNGDGFKDLVAGAPYYDEGNLTDAGRVLVYYGSSNGFSTTPNWALSGTVANAWFGWSVAYAGDINNDGYDDILIGAPNFTNGQAAEGAAFLFLGSPTGLSTTPSWSREGEQIGALFGVSVAAAGDVNQDGYGDIIIGAYLYDNGQTNEGAIFAFYGTPNGISRTPNWSAESNQASAQLGISVASAGDVNQDGYDDIIVGAYAYSNGQTGEGAAFLYKGSPNGLESTFSWSAEADQIGAQFGIAVAGVGDVNKDGFPDVAIGAPKFNNRTGKIFVYGGNNSGLTDIPVWAAEGISTGSELGSSLCAAGDIDNDGFADIVAGSWKYSGGQTNEGAVFVYYGSDNLTLNAAPNWMFESDQAGAQLGSSVAGLGDINRDGFIDIAAGAHLFDGRQTDQGRIFAFYGQAPRALINEFSQGNRNEGAAQWIEILVLQNNLDMRNWTVRNGNTTLFTFSPNQALWQALPAGTLIIIYNGGVAVKDTLLPPDDLSINDCNYRIVVSSANPNFFINRNWNNLINFDKNTPTNNPQLYDNATLFNLGTLVHDLDQNNEPDFIDLRPSQTSEAIAFQGNNYNQLKNSARWQSIRSNEYNTLITPGNPNGGNNNNLVYGLRPPTAILRLNHSKSQFCFGDSILFQAEFTGGNPPFHLRITDGTQNWDFRNILTRVFDFKVGGVSVGRRSFRIEEINGRPGSIECGLITLDILNQPAVPSLNSVTRICQAGAVTLTANPGIGGDEIRWYARQDTQSLLFTGAVYAIPNLTATTTYFVTTRNRFTGCQSTFSPATVIVGNGQKPIVCILSSLDLLPNLDGRIFASANGGTGGRYLFEIENLGFPNTEGNFTNLRPGTYTIIATDSNNCIGRSAPVAISSIKDNRTALIARGGDADEVIYSIASTSDGGYILAGATQSFGAGKQDAILMKVDANLNPTWVRVWGTPENDAFHKVIVTPEGGYLAVGFAENIPNNPDFLAVKVSPMGALEWRRTYFDAISRDTAFYVINTRDKGYLIVGSSASGGNSDMAIVKITQNGQTQWARFIGDIGNEKAVAALNHCKGGYVVGGTTTSFGSADLYLALIAEDGVVIDEKILGEASRNEIFSNLTNTPDEGYLIGAQVISNNNSDALIVKLDSNWNLNWATRLDGQGQENVAGAQVVPRGLGYVVSGSATSYGSGSFDVFLARLDLNGNIIWHRAYGASLADQAFDMLATSDGGFLVVGSSRSFDVSSEFMILKTDANGLLTASNCTNSFQTTVTRSQTFLNLANQQNAGLSVNTTNSFENPQPDLTINSVTTSELFPSIACGLSTPTARAEIITTQSTTICRGRSSSFRVSFTGKAPWSLRYTVNGAQETIINNINTPELDISVQPNNLGIFEYALREVRDGDNNIGTVGSQTFRLTVTLTSPATAILVTTQDQLCVPGQANLLVNLTGTPPWSLSYVVNNSSVITDINILSTPYNFSPTIPNVGNNIVRLVGIQDASGCTASGTVSGQALVQVQASTPLEIDLLSQTNADCNGNNASFRVSTRGGGNLAIVYSLDGINFNNTTGIFNDLRAGNYIVTARSGACLAVREINLLGAVAPEIVSINTAPRSTQNTVAIVWNGTEGARSYILAYKPSGTRVWQEVANITANTYNLTLDYDTQYDFRVRAVCPNNVLSEWSEIRTFRVPADPTNQGCLQGIPSIISISLVETPERNTVRVVWASVSGAINYILQFRNTSTGGAWQEVRGFTNTIANIILEPGFSYDFRVQAVCGTGTSPFSNIRSYTLPPITPSACLTNRPNILSITALNTTAIASLIRITWSVVSGARSYIVSYRETPAGDWIEVRGFTSAIAEINLENNVNYEFRVRAICDGSVQSDWSITTGYRTPSVNSPCLSNRPTITNVNTESVSGAVANVRVNWSAVNTARQYNLRYRVRNTTDPFQEIRGITTTTLLLSLEANTTYTFEVQAICEGGLISDWSTAAIHTTPEPQATECATANLQITNIEVISSDATTETIRLRWAPLATAQSYNVSYRTNSVEPWVEVRGIRTNSLDLVISKENIYEFRLQAVCTGGVTSSWSVARSYTPSSGNGSSICAQSSPNITSITTPNPQSANVVRISWNSIVGAAYYLLEYRQIGTIPFREVPNITTTSLDLPLDYSTTYEFRVRAFCSAGIPSQYSSIVSFSTPALPGGGSTTNCPPPGGINTQIINANTAVVNWEPITQNATCYIVSFGLQGTNPANWPQFVIPHPGNTLRMTNLIPANNYFVRIRTNCSSCALNSGQLSNWSANVPFSTPAAKLNSSFQEEVLIKAYPNPAQEVLQIEISGLESENALISLYNLTGEKLITTSLERSTETLTTYFNLGQLPAGLYLLEVKWGNKQFTEKIIKQ
ncbi:MAG: FG-GAP-like repeat-containing protein [Bacteroidia bacterium]|nr:FG-GAP-like repeat-containing protein [Bacteroidia bacterium]MDW8157335.1 FG-GAP-like repeat-containing protein [Bacteroidia bacterium]